MASRKTRLKICNKCNESLELTEFHVNRGNRDGRDGSCKSCRKLYYLENKDKLRESHLKYREANREAISKRARQYRIQNKEKIRISRAEYLARVREKNKEYHSRYYLENKEQINQKNSQWKRENRGAMNTITAHRRAFKLNATPDWLSEAQLAEIKHKYVLCKDISDLMGIPHHVDHISPLQGASSCGLHVPWNLQIITAEENLRKHNKESYCAN